MDTPVPEWAYQLVVVKLFGLVIFLWRHYHGIIDELVKKADDAQDAQRKAIEEKAAVHEEYSTKFQKLFKSTQEGS